MKYLAQMISNIKVGLISKSRYVKCKNTYLCIEVLKQIYNLGYISGFSILNKNDIRIFLKYSNNRSVISSIHFINSKKSKNYIKNKNFLSNSLSKNFNSYYSTLLCSTSYGILSDVEMITRKIGGSPIVKIN